MYPLYQHCGDRWQKLGDISWLSHFCLPSYLMSLPWWTISSGHYHELQRNLNLIQTVGNFLYVLFILTSNNSFLFCKKKQQLWSSDTIHSESVGLESYHSAFPGIYRGNSCMLMWPQEWAEGDESCNMVAIMGFCENCHPCVPSFSANIQAHI